MDLPPFLKTLSDLIQAFSDEPSLQGLQAELAWLSSFPAPPTPAPAPAPPGSAPPGSAPPGSAPPGSAPPGSALAGAAQLQFTRADRLREALGRYVCKVGPDDDLVRCPTPGCNRLRKP